MPNMRTDLLIKLDSLWHQGLSLFLGAPASETGEAQLGFKAPPHILQGENLAFIKSHKAEIIALLEEQSDLMQGYLASTSQTAMFLAQQLEPELLNFNLLAALSLKKNIDPELLETAIQHCIQEQPILSHQFKLSAFERLIHTDQQKTIIQKAGLQETKVQQFPAWSPDNFTLQTKTTESDLNKDAIKTLARQQNQQPFNLSTDALFRATLVQDNSNNAALIISCHHIVCDFIGLQNVLLKIQDNYQQLSDNEYSVNLKSQDKKEDLIKSHVLDEQSLLSDIEDNKGIPESLLNTYQQEGTEICLSGFECYQYPQQRASNYQPKNTDQEYKLELPENLSKALIKHCKDDKTTLFNWSMSLFSCLLARLNNQAQASLDTPIANRYGPHLHGAGHYTNPLALHFDFESPELSLQTLLVRSKEQLSKLLELQNYPAEYLQQRYAYRNNIAFSFNRVDNQAFQKVLYQELVLSEQAGCTHDLVVTGLHNNQEQSLSFNFRYKANTLNLDAVKRIAQAFLNLLVQSSQEGSANFKPLCANLLHSDEVDAFSQANATQHDYPNYNLAQQFFAAAEKHPQNIALTIPDSVQTSLGRTNSSASEIFQLGDQHSYQLSYQLSYQQLANRSKQLANWIKQENLASDSIAIYAERDELYLSSIIAGLANGKAIIPIDTQFPVERIEHMLNSAEAKLIFCRDGDLDKLRQINIQGLQLIALDQVDIQDLLKQQSTRFDCLETPADANIFTFFTSGSTGLPKAVPVQQQAVARLTHHNRFFKMEANQACLFASNISFDATNIEIWQALLNGGSLVSVDKNTFLSPVQLNQVFVQENVQHAFFTTALFNSLINYQADIFKNFITVMFGGEACDNSSIQACIQAGKPMHLQHLYGPTENGSISSYQSLDADNFDPKQSTSIGRATANTQLYIVDPFLNLQIPGAIGELLVGGDGVSEGYRSNAQINNIQTLNLEKFIPDSLHSKLKLKPSATQRLYRSGDYAYQDSSARVYFYGRFDDQLKIRGFRIQLSEIEQQLLSLDVVEKALVIAQTLESNAHGHAQQDSSDKQLVAYIVFKDSPANKQANQTEIISQLKTVLSNKLPPYMLPQHYMLLESLPINANGKLDKKQLPLPSTATELTPLHSDDTLEQALIDIWQQQCQLPLQSLDDNFFELGGNSLLAVRLSSALEHLLHEHSDIKLSGSAFSLRQLFATPSIRSLATWLRSQNQDATQAPSNKRLVTREQTATQACLASLSQQRLWFLQQLNPSSSAYNMPLALTISLKQECDTTAFITKLEQSLNQLLLSQPQLRANFHDTEGQATCIIRPQEDSLQHLAIQKFSTRQALEKALKTFSNRPFNLAQDHLFQAQLLQCEKDETTNSFTLALNIHHIIADGQSIALLLTSLAELLNEYAPTSKALKEQTEPQLDYQDFAFWQQQKWQDQGFADDIRYWQETLKGVNSSLNLPLDKPRPAIFSGQGASVKFSFNDAESQLIRDFVKAQKISLFMLMAASYQLLLARYTNSKDICIGFPVSGRTHSNTQTMTGLFVNNLVLRQTLDRDTSIQSLLAHSKQQTLAALEHQDLPFDLMLEQLDIEKSLSFTPLLQASFSVEEENLAQTIQGLFSSNKQATIHLADSHWHIAKYDLHLSCYTKHDAISGQLEYNSDIFFHTSMEQWVQHFKQLLLSLCQSNTEQKALSLDFLNSDERSKLISPSSGLNATAYPFKQQTDYLHQLIEQQCERSPENIALSDAQQNLSYAELNQQAELLAAKLIQTGVMPNDTVAICLNRSCLMSVSLFAILKAGANYTPLLIDTPSERLGFILSEVKAKVLLVDSRDELQLTKLANTITPLDVSSFAQNSKLDQHAASLIKERQEQLKTQKQPLFNIIYTSGSTGQPKGVMVSQAGIINRLLWMQKAYPLTEQDKVLQKTPYNFDVSGWELFWPLLVGASIHFAPPEAHKDPDSIVELICSQNISTIHFVPSMLQAFNSTQGLKRCESLRYVFTSGEALQKSQAQDLLSALPTLELHNLYGPTEAAIDVSYYACKANETRTSIPIGKPINNIRLYILDEQQQLLPQGAIGDLYISGIGLAQGYLNRQDLSDLAFTPNPYQQAEDSSDYSRLYKTGDVARYLDDGNIEYLGRSDHQVKLRGLRIELGEIEAQLLSIDGIEQCVVIKQSVRHEEQLVAYYVADNALEDEENAALHPSLSDQAIREQLKDKLPAYMLPFCFIALDKLPLSANGKLDRKQLPKAENLLVSEQSYQAPENETEQIIVDMFAEVLQISGDNIGIHDNFFHLGGHSLLATKLASRIRSQFDCDLELKEVFDHSSPYALSLRIIEKSMHNLLEMDDIDDDDLLALLDDL